MDMTAFLWHEAALCDQRLACARIWTCHEVARVISASGIQSLEGCLAPEQRAVMFDVVLVEHEIS